MTQTRWLIRAPQPEALQSLSNHYHPIIATLLWERGARTLEMIERFLHPDYCKDINDPYLFRDMQCAVERVFTAIQNKERITVHGDYDADGVCGASIIATALEALGATFDIFLPHRERDGYGVSVKTVEELAARGTKLIITSDCGIKSVAEVARANALGVDVIITDHHLFDVELPRAHAILHPLIAGETYPDKFLTGGGVAWKFAHGIAREAERRKLPIQEIRFGPDVGWDGFVKWLLDLAAISTVADLGALAGENRVIVTYGLKVLAHGRRVGLRKLMQLARVGEELTTTTIGFQIAPRINAAGRMDHANTAYMLLMSKDELNASQLALQLERNNQDRQKLTERITTQAIAQAERFPDDPVLLVYDASWPAGVLGLIASKIVERFGRPVFVLGGSADRIVGSGRSIEELDIITLLDATKEQYARYGGHAQACGLTLKPETDISALRAAVVAATLKLEPFEIGKTILVDAELPFAQLDDALFAQLQSLKPYGKGNHQPRFVARNVRLKDLQRVGKTQTHARLSVASDNGTLTTLIAFGFAERLAGALNLGDALDIIYEVEANHWNGVTSKQFRLIDFKVV